MTLGAKPAPVIAKTVPPAPAAGVTVSAAVVAGGAAVGLAGRATGEVARVAVAVRVPLRRKRQISVHTSVAGVVGQGETTCVIG